MNSAPQRGELSDQLEKVLPRYDIVFATARMALEAAAVGCAVVVVDGRGFAGMLRSENLKAWRRLNFGVGLLTAPVTAASLDAAIAAYDAADAAEVCERLRAEASADDYAAAYLELYTQAIGEGVAQEFRTRLRPRRGWKICCRVPLRARGSASQVRPALWIGRVVRPSLGCALALIAAFAAIFNPLAIAALAAVTSRIVDVVQRRGHRVRGRAPPSNRASLTRRPFSAGPCSVSNCAALPLLPGIRGSLSLQCRRRQVGRRACEVHRQSRMQSHAGLFHLTPSGERDPRPFEISVAGRRALPTGSNADRRQSFGNQSGRCWRTHLVGNNSKLVLFAGRPDDGVRKFLPFDANTQEVRMIR